MKKDEEPAEPAEPEKTATPLQEEPKPQESAENVVAEDVAQPEEPKTEEVNDGQDRVAVADNSGEDTRGQEDSGVSSERPGSESAQ